MRSAGECSTDICDELIIRGDPDSRIRNIPAVSPDTQGYGYCIIINKAKKLSETAASA